MAGTVPPTPAIQKNSSAGKGNAVLPTCKTSCNTNLCAQNTAALKDLSTWNKDDNVVATGGGGGECSSALMAYRCAMKNWWPRDRKSCTIAMKISDSGCIVQIGWGAGCVWWSEAWLMCGILQFRCIRVTDGGAAEEWDLSGCTWEG